MKKNGKNGNGNGDGDGLAINGNLAMKSNVVPIKKGGFMDAIQQVAAAPEPKAAKKNGAVILTPPQKIREAIDELVRWKAEEKKAKAEKEACEGDILPWTKEQQDQMALKGNFTKSFKVLGVKETVTFVASDKFSPIQEENIHFLQEIMGKEFNNLVTQKTTVTLKEEVMNDESLQEELMELIGDRFAKFFTASVQHVVVDGFDQKVYGLGKKVEQVREFVKQTKASLK